MSAYQNYLHPVVLNEKSNRAARIEPTQPFLPRLLSRVLICWHRKMSRPFTRQGETYRVCLRCGMRRQFDLREWKTKGDYYNPSTRSLR